MIKKKYCIFRRNKTNIELYKRVETKNLDIIKGLPCKLCKYNGKNNSCSYTNLCRLSLVIGPTLYYIPC